MKLFLFMVYTGSFIYGGGLVLIPFIEKYVVTVALRGVHAAYLILGGGAVGLAWYSLVL